MRRAPLSLDRCSVDFTKLRGTSAGERAVQVFCQLVSICAVSLPNNVDGLLGKVAVRL